MIVTIDVNNSNTLTREMVLNACNDVTQITKIKAFKNSSNLYKIGIGALSDCINLTEFNFSNFTYIADYAFYNSNLSNAVNYPFYGSQLSYIGKYAFSNTSLSCINISRRQMTNSITIDDHAFENCTNLAVITNLATTNSFNKIGNYSFSGCIKLASFLTTLDNVNTIGDYAFAGCTKFPSSLNLPECTEIGRYAFANCSQLTSLIAPKCTFVDYNALSGTSLYGAEPFI